MKKKILLSLVACFIAAGSFIGYNFAENNHNMDISLADISVMAQADGESGGTTTCYKGGGGLWSGSVPTCQTGCPYVWLSNYSKTGTCYF
ncbi:MAG: hypothetical protein ACOCWM_02145 [Cyclobacteriaceae bacterium]